MGFKKCGYIWRILFQNGFHSIVLEQQFCLAQTMKFSSAPLHKTTYRITLFVKKMLAELAHNQDLKMHCFSHFFTCIMHIHIIWIEHKKPLNSFSLVASSNHNQFVTRVWFSSFAWPIESVFSEFPMVMVWVVVSGW